MDQPMGWKASEGGWLLKEATVLVREQQGLEGSEALPLGLQPENSYCWESLFLDLTPNPLSETLLPGPHLRIGLSGGPGTSFLLPNPKPKCPPPYPPPNRQPRPAGTPSLPYRQHHLFIPALTPLERLLGYPTSSGSSLCRMA